MLTLEINGNDKTDQIDWTSLEKEDVLTKEPDRLQFKIKNYGSKTYRPEHGDEVILTDDSTGDDVVVFAGIVVESVEESAGMLRFYTVICKDYQHLIDRKLVNRTYTSQTVADIIQDIIDDYIIDSGFTKDVSSTRTVDKIIFNDEPVSKCLQRLADYLGNADWYVDYEKVIHFFHEGDAAAAPFALTDIAGTHISGSLKISRNINQIRNTVIVRGGVITSSLITDTKVADGQQRTFVAKPQLTNLTIQLDDGGGFDTLTIGQDGVDDPTTKDVLYNPNNGFIIFPEASKPAATYKVKWSGNQTYPIKVVARDWGSIGTYGVYEYIIRDETIKTSASAIQRAKAEITKYAERANELYFRTYTPGLRSGQAITVYCPTTLGMSTIESFKITRVSLRTRTPDSFEYEVKGLASEDVGVIDVLGKLLIGDQAALFTTLENEVLVQVESFDEVITLTEGTFTATKWPTNSPVFAETLTVGESITVNPFGLNVTPQWVAGPYFRSAVSDRKRVPIADHEDPLFS